jgi:hypothetical protein
VELANRFPEEEIIEHFGIERFLGEPLFGGGCPKLDRVFMLKTALPSGTRGAVVGPVRDKGLGIHCDDLLMSLENVQDVQIVRAVQNVKPQFLLVNSVNWVTGVNWVNAFERIWSFEFFKTLKTFQLIKPRRIDPLVDGTAKGFCS